MKPFHQAHALSCAVFTLVLFGATTLSSAQVHTEPVLFDGHYYAVNKDCMTWSEADEYTQSLTFKEPGTGNMLAGHLVTLTSQQENDFIHQTFVSGEWTHAWLGAYRSSDEEGIDSWKWVTREPWDFSNWYEGQPEGAGENYGSMMNFTQGTWHDYPDGYYECGYRFNIVEFETPSYTCSGFKAPAHKKQIKVYRHRSIPLKVQIQNRKGDNMTPQLLPVPPRVVIQYIPGVNGGSQPPGLVTGGNQDMHFNSREGTWNYKLRTRDCCRDAGVYRVSVRSGDEESYKLRDICTVDIVKVKKRPKGRKNYKLNGRKHK